MIYFFNFFHSQIESGIFGVKLSSTCNKEGLKVPAFVTACIEEVEKRGLDEMGIYRVSGTTSDVQRIRKAFDKGKQNVVILSYKLLIHLNDSCPFKPVGAMNDLAMRNSFLFILPPMQPS